jgi:large subunit ribosomal protein L33
MAREYVWLECTESGMRNYRVSKETRGTDRLELRKYCPKLRRHTLNGAFLCWHGPSVRILQTDPLLAKRTGNTTSQRHSASRAADTEHRTGSTRYSAGAPQSLQ